MNRIVILLALSFVLTMCKSPNKEESPIVEATNKVVLASEIKWEKLNPARGEKSPKAGTLWGNRKGTEATGFLVKFVDGFSSPPHIHNVSYRGVVIEGLVHNDDPNAKEMWMPTGSFWTQPAGEVHITAAKGNENIAFIEIEKGPYLVLPTEKEFDNGERPINVDKTNMVWIDQTDENTINGHEVSYLWGKPKDNELNGTLLKLPTGFSGQIHSKGKTFKAVLIQGQLQYQMPNETETKTLEAGSYFSSTGDAVHQVSSKDGEECIIYIRTKGKYEVIAK